MTFDMGGCKTFSDSYAIYIITIPIQTGDTCMSIDMTFSEIAI